MFENEAIILHNLQFSVVEKALQHNHFLPPLSKVIYYENLNMF